MAGVSETRIAEHTGHRDLNVMRRYYRNGMVFKGNPAKEIGLWYQASAFAPVLSHLDIR